MSEVDLLVLRTKWKNAKIYVEKYQDTIYVKIKAEHLCMYEHMQMHKGDRKRSHQNRDRVSFSGGK